MKIKSLIVDDEKRSRLNLKNLVAEYCPQVEIIEEAEGIKSAIKIIKSEKIDLLFLDIEMPGGTGFDLLEMLGKDYPFEVIFVTAFDKYGIQAIKFCAIDYILKPINIIELGQAVEKAKNQILKKEENKKLQEFIANIKREKNEKKIALPLADKIIFIAVDEIIRLEADGNYTTIYEEGGSKYLVCKIIKEYQEILENYDFIRTHQSHLINIHKISSYIKSDGGFIKMIDGSSVPISRQKKDEVLKRIL